MCMSCNKTKKTSTPQRPASASAKKTSAVRSTTNPWATTPKVKSNFKIGR